MAKGIIEFDLNEPEEAIQFSIASNIDSYHSVVWELKHNLIGNWSKNELSAKEILDQLECLVEDVPTYYN